MSLSVEVNNICKTYNKGNVTALDNIDFSIHEGELFGIIGPDGAGKTTLFRILTTLLLADSGEAKVCGYDVVKDYKMIRNISGYMPGKFSLYQDLSIEENINFFATVFNTTFEQNRYLIEDIYIQLEPFKDRPAGKLSGGMKQKLALCCALIHEPKILFLDEPTTGVDPVSRKEFWEILARLKSRGITIVVSTPYMDEASKCDRIALINDGKILKVNTLENIIKDYHQTLFAISSNHKQAILKQLRLQDFVDTAFSFGETLHVTLKDDSKVKEFENLVNSIDPFSEIGIIEPTIEDVFMQF